MAAVTEQIAIGYLIFEAEVIAAALREVKLPTRGSPEYKTDRWVPLHAGLLPSWRVIRYHRETSMLAFEMRSNQLRQQLTLFLQTKIGNGLKRRHRVPDVWVYTSR